MAHFLTSHTRRLVHNTIRPWIQQGNQKPFGSRRHMSGGRLQDKVAIITGSTKGIGFEIARRYAEEGARVVISSRKEDNVNEAVETLRNLLDNNNNDNSNNNNNNNNDNNNNSSSDNRVSGVVCHVGNETHRNTLLQHTMDTYGRLDCLVVSAGINPYVGPFLQTPEDKWDRIFDINVKSSFLLARDAMPHLEASRGSILFNSTIGTQIHVPGIGAYAMSKAAVDALVKLLAVDCGRRHVRVNGISPGIVETEFGEVLTHSEEADAWKNLFIMGRFGKPTECSGAAVFLCSDEASYITGENIQICGGKTIGVTSIHSPTN